MEAHPRGKARRGDLVPERGPFRGSDAIMKLEIRSGLCQALRHAQQRRYADAAREQERTACIDQREVIARRTDLHQVALPYDVVHGARAASRLRVPKDRNTIVAAISVIVA